MKSKFDQEVILEKAMLLFWEHGFQGCSMAILKKELGLSPSSIYHAWDSKEGLFKVALQRYGKKVTLELVKALDKNEDGYQAIINLFQFILQFHCDGKEGAWGCLTTNTIAEMTLKNSNISTSSSALTNLLESAFKRAIIRGQQQKKINPKLSPDYLASFLMTILHGIHVRVKTSQEVRNELQKILPIIQHSLS